MASIRKHGNKYEVQYRVPGCKKPQSERFDTIEEAELRKAEINIQKKRGTFVPLKSTNILVQSSQADKNITVEELMKLYIKKHGVTSMTAGVLCNTERRIRDYINPQIGNIPIGELTPLVLQSYYVELAKTPAKANNAGEFVGPSTIKKCHADLRAALNWAIGNGILPLGCNAALYAKPPAYEEEDAISWDYDQFLMALEVCKDPQLKFIILMCVTCTMRISELLGLTWDHVEYREDGGGNVFIEHQIQRAKEEYLNRSLKTKAFYVFPKTNPKSQSVLFLTTPKKNSARHVPFGETVEEALKAHKERQDLEKQLMYPQYEDYGLVVARQNGRPYESKSIRTMLIKFCDQYGLPGVCTHSLRHTSVDVKLELSGGNIKAVMADAGHRTESMVTKQYSALRERRRFGIADSMDNLLKTKKMPASPLNF